MNDITNSKTLSELALDNRQLTAQLQESQIQIGVLEAAEKAGANFGAHASGKIAALELQIDILSALIKGGDLQTASLMVADWEAAQ